jgi:AraC family transcriptional regulator
MLQEKMPEIFASAVTASGVSLQIRRDFRGVLDVPGQEAALIAIHLGMPTKLTCRRDGRQYNGTSVHGDIDIIPAETPSRWEMHDDNDNSLLVILPPALLRAVARESDLDLSGIEIRNRFQIRDLELEALCLAMKREMELRFPSGRLYLDGLALAAASRVVARHSSVATQPERHLGVSGRRLKQVLSFIEEQLSEDLSLERIAAVAGISSSHMNTLFRQSMGLPVHQYVIQRRVELAKSLLLESGMSITEIALAAGFTHQSHMARHMRRVLGIPPRAMKRLLSEAIAAR